MQDHLQSALQYHRAGFRIVPTSKEKRPINLLKKHDYKWDVYQAGQTEDDVKELFSKPCYGIQILTNVDGLEVIDIDTKYSLEPGMEAEYMKFVEEQGGFNITDLTIVETPSKGLHIYYRCDQPGESTALAKRPPTEEELAKNPNEKAKPIFETKGIGGLITGQPTPGYRVIFGKMSSIPKITMAERAILINAAKSFNQFVKPEEIAAPPREKAKFEIKGEGKPSWEDYNEKTDAVWLLEKHGWKALHERGDKTYFRRPGKRDGMSGNFNRKLNLFRCFSTSSEFDSDKSYTPFGIYALLEHRGNWSEAAKELCRQGYGEKSGIIELPEHPKGMPAKQPTDPSEIDAALRLRKYDYFNRPKHIDFILKADVEGESFDVGGLGMLGLVTGLEKSRKTTFLKALIASMLEDGKKRINFSLRLNGKKAIFVDTEQPEQFFHRTQTHAHELAGIRGNTPLYDAYAFRDVSIDERVEYIDYLIKNTPDLGLVVLDGVLDLVKNFNDETQCQVITQKILKWTSESNAMILTVIHEGKGSGFMMGHLGSALARKCDFAIKMTHNSDSQFTEVSCKLARTRPFPKFEFTQDENGYPILDHNQKAIEAVLENSVPYSDYTTPKASVLVTPGERNVLDEVPF